MIAYKFLRPGAVAPFSGLRWPTPSPAGPGDWVVARGGSGASADGVHASRVPTLAYWLAEELWEAEIEGPIVDAGRMVVGSRGRLLRRIDGWGPGLARELGDACGRRAREAALEAPEAGAGGGLVARLEGYADDAEAFARKGAVAVTAYVAAHVAGCLAAGESGDASAYRAAAEGERRRQAGWLADRLGLRDRE